MRWPKIDVSLRDLHIYGGLAVAAWGGSYLSTPWTGIALGVILAALGIFAPRRRA